MWCNARFKIFIKLFFLYEGISNLIKKKFHANLKFNIFYMIAKLCYIGGG